MIKLLLLFIITLIVSMGVATLIWFISFLLSKQQQRKVGHLQEFEDLKNAQMEAKVRSGDEEVSAAIAMALHLYFAELHDYERTVLTIKKVVRPYSPWSSKIYAMRNMPRQ